MAWVGCFGSYRAGGFIFLWVIVTMGFLGFEIGGWGNAMGICVFWWVVGWGDGLDFVYVLKYVSGWFFFWK